jgi:hypothetical protein
MMIMLKAIILKHFYEPSGELSEGLSREARQGDAKYASQTFGAVI